MISYKKNIATTEQVWIHLKQCNDQFVPSLDQKVDLEKYAAKITAYATRFEAWNNDELIGLIAAYFNDDEKVAFITNVSVIRQYNGKGVASQLMTECFKQANTIRFNAINLRVASNNASAIGLYSKFGFKQTTQEDDEIVMQKELHS